MASAGGGWPPLTISRPSRKEKGPDLPAGNPGLKEAPLGAFDLIEGVAHGNHPHASARRIRLRCRVRSHLNRRDPRRPSCCDAQSGGRRIRVVMPGEGGEPHVYLPAPTGTFAAPAPEPIILIFWVPGG